MSYLIAELPHSEASVGYTYFEVMDTLVSSRVFGTCVKVLPKLLRNFGSFSRCNIRIVVARYFCHPSRSLQASSSGVFLFAPHAPVCALVSTMFLHWTACLLLLALVQIALCAEDFYKVQTFGAATRIIYLDFTLTDHVSGPRYRQASER
jgi:hypothetical protein